MMRIKGFSRSKTKWWLKALEYDKQNNTINTQDEKRWAYEHGFLPKIVTRYGINKHNYKDYISLYDYCAIFPINDVFGKWLTDKVTTRKVLKPYKDYFPKQYFHLYLRDESPMVIRLDDCPYEYSDDLDGVLSLIKDLGKVSLTMTSGTYGHIIEYSDGNYYYQNNKVEIEVLKTLIINQLGIRIIEEPIESGSLINDISPSGGILRIIFYNKYGNNPKIGQAYLRLSSNTEENNETEDLLDDITLNDFVKTNRKYLDDKKLTKLILTSKTLDEVIVKLKEQLVNEENVREAEKINQLLLLLDKSNLSNIKNEIYVDDSTLKNKVLEDESIQENLNLSDYFYIPIDTNKGTFDGGKMLRNNTIIDIDKSPATKFNLKGSIKNWDELNGIIEQMGLFIPQIEFMSIDISITENGFKFIDFRSHPFYPQAVGFNKEITDYIKIKINHKKDSINQIGYKTFSFWEKFNMYIWRNMARKNCPPTMKSLMYKDWVEYKKDDMKNRDDVPKEIVKWAHSHGFLSYRLAQYGINKDNYNNFISDFDYLWIRHINNKYKIWLEDKITIKYICDKYNEYFPKYYYHYTYRNGQGIFIKLMDCPNEYNSDFESIIELVKKVKVLACKPQKGSFGRGFYKFEYINNTFYMNNIPMQSEQIKEILTDKNSQYLITEFIVQHEDINKIYPGSVNTMRILVYKRDGKTPKIGTSYIRFGSSKTGTVDNISAGGMCATVDMETGKIHNPKMIDGNNIIKTKNHPDTDVAIEGYIPHFDSIKESVIKISKELEQIEWLGFDIAITENGIKIPEINRSPGFPKIEDYSKDTIDYLVYKREAKKKRLGVIKTI